MKDDESAVSRQENPNAVENMLASIRQAIHRETAHQVTGLHAAGGSAPANDEARPAVRPLTMDDPDTDWNAPLHPPHEDARAGEAGYARPDPAARPGAAAPRKSMRRVIGGVMSGQVGLDDALERLNEAPQESQRGPGADFHDPAFEETTLSETGQGADDDGGSWWPDDDALPPAVAEEADAQDRDDAPLLSPQASRAAAEAFSRLKSELGGERELSRMTEELLRPMLRQWLNEHLPALVEQMVREEIQRISRGGLKD